MKPIPSESTVRPLRLRAGQAMHIPVRPGTAVQMLAGSASVSESMRWLADSHMLRPAHRMAEGQWLRMEDGGWLVIEARAAEAQLLLVEPAEPLAWLWRRLRALLAGRRLARQQA